MFRNIFPFVGICCFCPLMTFNLLFVRNDVKNENEHMDRRDISILAGGKELFNKVTKSPLGLKDVSAEQWLVGAFSTAHSSHRPYRK